MTGWAGICGRHSGADPRAASGSVRLLAKYSEDLSISGKWLFWTVTLYPSPEKEKKAEKKSLRKPEQKPQKKKAEAHGGRGHRRLYRLCLAVQGGIRTDPAEPGYPQAQGRLDDRRRGRRGLRGRTAESVPTSARRSRSRETSFGFRKSNSMCGRISSQRRKFSHAEAEAV